MQRHQLKPCDCGPSNYRLLPRHWWMRAIPGRRRYRCKVCNATMLLRTANARRRSKRAVVLLLLALLVVAWVSFSAVGYREDWSYASWKRWAEGQ